VELTLGGRQTNRILIKKSRPVLYISGKPSLAKDLYDSNRGRDRIHGHIDITRAV
jgi:hypothetical protein